MTCLGDEERINRYLDGELNPSERAQFEEHLGGCTACQRELAQARALFAVLDGLQAAPAPVDLRAEVLAGLPRRQTAPLGRWVLAAQVATSLVLLGLAWPTLQSWYERLATWLAPGWLSNLAAEALTWVQDAWAWLASTLVLNVDWAWPRGLGLTWSQAAVVIVALVGFWVLGNRLLLAHRLDERGGIA